MINVAILGYGVVGSGVLHVLMQNAEHIKRKAGQEVKVKRVLDLRSFPGDPVEPLLTKDFNGILNDPEVDIVTEVMGGLEPAFTYCKKALEAGKHVCTSNKELVAAHGAELLALAKANNVNFLFEASVGGAIPIVRPMNLALTTDEVTSVSGILNGTSNYILTQMSAFGGSFEDALAEARQKGYAEKDPTNDVEGYDACRKLAILLSLAAGRQVDFGDIYTEGISELDRADFAFARLFGYTIKLMVDGRLTQHGIEALTAPMLVHHSHPLATVADVFNGVQVCAKMTDSVMFFGRGAGRLPTAGAVVSDIVDAAKHPGKHIMHLWSSEKAAVLPFEGYVRKKMVRVKYTDAGEAKERIQKLFGGETVYFYELPEYPNQLAFFTPGESEAESAEKLKQIEVERVIRIYG